MDQPASDTQTLTDPMDPARATALAATLGEARSYGVGDPLSPLAHHIYFWMPQPPQALGRDGKPGLHGLVPDFGLSHSSLVGGRLLRHNDLLAGVRAERTSRVEKITPKADPSGEMIVVRLRHDVRQRQTLAVTEWQDINFSATDNTGSPPPIPAQGETISQTLKCDGTMLFRYAALTFDSHRIHLDDAYARSVGYSAVVVQDALLLHALMDFAIAEIGDLRSFDYRVTSSLMVNEAATLCRRGHDFWVRGPDGRVCLTAMAR